MSNKIEIRTGSDLNSFINKLQLEDKKIEQIYMLLKITYIVLIVIYIPIFYFEFITKKSLSITEGM